MPLLNNILMKTARPADYAEEDERINEAVRDAKQRGKAFGLFRRVRKRSVSEKVVGGRLAALLVQRLKKEGL